MTTLLNIDSGFGQSLVDRLLEPYVSWREECLTVHLAYKQWTDSDRDERKLAYAGYLAALDREEQAARVYAREVEWVRRIGT
jgi:hypothetical protein